MGMNQTYIVSQGAKYTNEKSTAATPPDAHFWGAVFGFVFTLIFDPTHGQIFFQQLVNPRFNF